VVVVGLVAAEADVAREHGGAGRDLPLGGALAVAVELLLDERAEPIELADRRLPVDGPEGGGQREGQQVEPRGQLSRELLEAGVRVAQIL
jgi:hypothetical protein